MFRPWVWRFGWLMVGLAVTLGALMVVAAIRLPARAMERQQDALRAAMEVVRRSEPTVSLPDEIGPLYEAEQLFQRSRLGAALKLYAKAVERDPNDARAYALWGRTLIIWGDPTQALTKIDRAIELAPGVADYHAYRCAALDWSDRYAEAIRACEQGRQLDASNILAHAYLAEALADAGQIDQALTVARDALALDEQSVDALRGYGYALQAAGRFDEAERAYRKATELAPDLIEFRLSLARFLRSNGDPDGAIAELQRLVPTQADNPRVFIELGVTYYQQKQYPRARPFFEEALKLDDSRAIPHRYLGWSYYLQEEYEPSLSHFEAAVRLAPQQIDALSGLGRTQLAMGQYEAAVDSFNRILTLDPNNESAKEGLAEAQEYLGQG